MYVCIYTYLHRLHKRWKFKNIYFKYIYLSKLQRFWKRLYIYIYIYRIDGEEINNSLYLAQKYARIFVRGYYLVQDTNSFPRAKQKRLGKYSPLLSTLKWIIVLVNTTQKTKKRCFFFHFSEIKRDLSLQPLGSEKYLLISFRSG